MWGVDSPVVNFSGAFSYHVVQSHIRISKILMVKWEFSHVIFLLHYTEKGSILTSCIYNAFNDITVTSVTFCYACL